MARPRQRRAARRRRCRPRRSRRSHWQRGTPRRLVPRRKALKVPARGGKPPTVDGNQKSQGTPTTWDGAKTRRR